MWWHTVNTDKPPPSGRWEATETYSLQKPRAFPQWESTMTWTQSAPSFDLDIIEKPDVGAGPARRHRARTNSIHEGSRPRTASSMPKSPGAQSVMMMQSPTAKLGGQRPGSAPTLLRSHGPPARDTMSLAGEPNEKDVFRQRMEDTAVADTIGKWRFEVDIKKKQFKDMDMKDTTCRTCSCCIMAHSGRLASAMPKGQGHRTLLQGWRGQARLRLPVGWSQNGRTPLQPSVCAPSPESCTQASRAPTGRRARCQKGVSQFSKWEWR